MRHVSMPSKEATGPMADLVTKAPDLDSVSWNSDGSVHISWTNNAVTGATYSSIEVSARVAGGAPRAIFTISGSAINARTADIASNSAIVWDVGADYVLTLRAFGPAGWSLPSSGKTLNGLSTPTPSISSAARPSASAGLISLDVSPVPPVTVIKSYVQCRLEGTATWKQVNATTTAGQRTINVPGLDGTRSYEVRVQSTGSAGVSAWSSVKTIPAYYTRPAGVSDLLHARASNGQVTLTWSGTSTATGPYTGQRIYRAVGATGQLQVYKTIAGTARSWTDTAAVSTQSYRYAVEPYSPMGAASSRPERAVPASILIPNAPSAAPTVAYVATNKVDVTWVRNATTDRPYTSQKVLRRKAGATAWATIATVAGTATSFTDAPGANSRLEYAILPVNAAGEAASTSPVSAVATTIPAPPGSLTAKWSGASSILVSWPNFSSVGDAIDLEFSTDNSTWQTAATGLAISARSWTHASVSTTVPHWYRLRVRRTDATTTPASAWVKSAVVTALTTPLAPTVSLPQSVDATDVIRVEWVHRPVDGTTQTKAEVKVGSTTYTVTGGNGYYDIPAGTLTNGTSYSLTVRTAGASGTLGPWSSGLTLAAQARPTVAITSPAAGAWAAQTLRVEWTSTGYDHLVELLNGSGTTLLQSRRLTATGSASTSFDGLDDQTAYLVRVTSRDAVQWSLPTTVAITTDFERPGPPFIWGEFREATATTALGARPGADYRINRVNYAQPDDQWERGAGSAIRDLVTLTHPQTGVSHECSQVQFTALGQSVFHITHHEFAGGTPLVGTVTVSAPEPGATVFLGIGLLADPVWAAESVAVPVWPETVTLAIEAESPTGEWAQSLVIRPDTIGSLYLFDTAIITGPTPIDPTYFTSTTRSDQYVYVGDPRRGEVFELEEVSTGGDFTLVETERIDFYRSLNGGSTWQLVGESDRDWTRVDLLPPLAPILYKARAYGAAGGWAESDPITVDCTSRDIHLNFGAGWLGHVRGGRFTGDSSGGGRESVVHDYGRPTFTAYQAEELTPRSITRTVQLLSDASTYEEWIDALGSLGEVVYREPMGLSLRGVAQLGSWGRESRYKSSVAFTIHQTSQEVS